MSGRSRVPLDADDHVDAADGGARGRLRQAGDGDMLARNVEQPAGILEKGVMMVTDVGVEIGVRAGKGILCTIAAVRHQRNQVVATLLLLINSRCRDPRVRCWLKTTKQRFRRRDSDLDPERPLFDDIEAEINDREC